MEKLKGPMAFSFKGRDVTNLVGKFKHLALNTPLQFGGQTLRAHTRSIARFGGLSHHSFFSRHNPHPHRVTHIQGLNGIPVCIVNDEWSKQTILSPHPMIKSHPCTSISEVPGVQMPIGDPQPFPIPRLSVGSLSEAWREELKELAAGVRAAASSSTENVKKETREKSQRRTQYSEETGRLVPPSSRATARHSSHRINLNNGKNKGKAATSSFQDQELIILELLCQILQTDSLTAIQQWLLAAGQQEKNLVMGLLQIATAKQDLEPQELTISTEEKFQSQSSLNATGFAFKQQSLGRNQIRLSVISQKQEPVPKEDKPVHINTAEVLKIHSSLNEKQNQLDQTN